MRWSTAVVAGAALGVVFAALAAIAGAGLSDPSPRTTVSAPASPNGLIYGEQRLDLPDCAEEDGSGGPVPCVWDRWIRGSNPNPGVLPRYVIVKGN